MEIRPEEEKDYFEVEDMVRNSFWNVYRPGAFEHLIVHRLRNDDSFIPKLAYVIEDDGKIIGHINYSRGMLECENQTRDAVVLGPVAIHEDYQNRGLGTELIEYTLDLARDYPFVFVIGDEKYYKRFGFESASKYGIYLDGTDLKAENPFFMIRVSDESEIPEKTSIFRNPEVFIVDEDDADEFDRKFEYKQKMVLEGQLGD